MLAFKFKVMMVVPVSRGVQARDERALPGFGKGMADPGG
jgi:hypothetical protein